MGKIRAKRAVLLTALFLSSLSSAEEISEFQDSLDILNKIGHITSTLSKTLTLLETSAFYDGEDDIKKL
jgi:hypothetical protein